jgi:myo-inositol catabolism protein IolC
MNKKEIIKQLQEASNWIYETSNYEESNEPHIKDMMEGIENAINTLSMDVIEVDIAFYHPDDDETIKVYDIEGMTQEFDNKLSNIIKNN